MRGMLRMLSARPILQLQARQQQRTDMYYLALLARIDRGGR